MRRVLALLWCWIGLHHWRNGLGECCATCGTADWLFPGSAPGRKAVHVETLERRYFPCDRGLPSGWRWERGD